MVQRTWGVGSAARLDVFLRERIPALLAEKGGIPPGEGVSNGKVRRLIMAGAVQVDGLCRRVPAFALRPGSAVTVRLDPAKFFFEKQPDDVPFMLTAADVLYEDDVLLVVNKPPFLPTEATVVAGRPCMHQAAVDYLWRAAPSLRNPPYVGIMHRLDRETSGVLLFTKSRVVNAAVQGQFSAHTVQKTYRAVCAVPASCPYAAGNGFSAAGTMGRVSAKSAPCRMGFLPADRGGKEACTDFSVVAVQGGFLYVDCRPRTGRTHQIRLQLSQAGIPIAGDELYGGTRSSPGSGDRIMLHAARLDFLHPVTGQPLSPCAPLPPGFSPPA